jgi:hypothetical protein
VKYNNRKKSARKSSQSRALVTEILENRQLLSATISVSQSLMVFNAVQNSAASPVETLTITNTGDAALSLNGLSVVSDGIHTDSSARFTLVNAGNEPASLAPGASFGLQVQYAANAVGLQYAMLDIASSDTTTPTDQIQLHGIGTTGTGGGNQPSLELILEAYDEVNYTDVGETNINSAYYPEPPAASDEIALQELVKAGPGPVTINVLASFTAASTKPYTLGWYNVSDPTDTRQQLFYTPTSESQSVYIQPQGVTSFDPGSTVFGFYNPSATVKVNNQLVTGYTQDDLNTWDSNSPTPDYRKFRFFPLEDGNGNPIANSYIMTSTEWYNSAGYDFTNIVAIVSNVMAAPSAPSGPVLSISNPDQLPSSNTLLFNRIQNPNGVVGDTVHDTNTITLENSGSGNLTINSITVAATTSSNGGTQYQLVNPPSTPFTLTPGQTQAVEIQFVLSQANANGHSANETNSAGNGGGGSDYPGILTITSTSTVAPTTTIPLEGWWQEHSENENEPNLQTMVNLMAGYSTEIDANQSPFLTEGFGSGSSPAYYGEEVVSPYWAMADSTTPVQVTQLGSFHTQGDTAGLDYFPQGSSSSTHNILNTAADDGQAFFPLNSSSNLAAGTFTTAGSFGFEVLNPNTYSDDALNVGDDGGGHLIRFYPVRDASGNLVPNTYILACDYPNGTNENFDFNDTVYIISNIRPTSAVAVSSPQSTGGAPTPQAVSATETSSGVSLQWEPVIDTTLSGYNIYSSLSATTGYALVNTVSSPADSYLDTTALPGETVYYRIAAIDSAGVGLGAQTSVVTTGTPSTNLQSIGINETPTGSTTAVTTDTAYTIVAGGPGVTGTSDGFRYVFATQSGNFDVAVQVSSLTVAGNFSTAGIMVRDSLGASAANVYMSASPTNFRFKDRTADGDTEAVDVGTYALSYPNVWVRLTRVGDVFSGYTSTNGVIWTLMEQVTLANFPTNAYLGLAVASNNNTATTTAQLADYGPTVTQSGPVTTPETYTVSYNQSVQEPVLAPDVDATGTIDPTSFTIITGPNEGGTASYNTSTQLLTYTPAVGFVGTETVTYTIADSNGAVSSPTTLTFNVAETPPVAVADSFTAVAGHAQTLNVLANDTDADSTLNPATVTIVSQPNSGATLSVNTSTGMITYIAPSTFKGTDTFTYTVTDNLGQVSAPATVTVTVSAAPPSGLMTHALSVNTSAGLATVINVLATATDTTGTIIPGSVIIVSQPNHGGSASVNSDGTITYTALLTYSGTEKFSYTVTDSAGATSAATVVTVTVGKPAGPVATSGSSAATANGSTTVNVESSVSSIVGLNLASIKVGTQPSHGTTSINYSTGVITYTPSNNYVGPDKFTYTVADVDGNVSNAATVNVSTGVTVGTVTGNDRSLTFTSAGGAVTTVSLNRGSVMVMFTNAGTLSVDRLGRATVTGSSLQISDLQLTGTTAASTLSISSRGTGTLNIGGISDPNPLRMLSAPRSILTGAVNLNGISTLQALQISDAQLTVGTGVPAGFSLVAGSLSDTTLSSSVPIRLIQTTTWTSSTASASSITAPSIVTLNIAGAFQPKVTLTGGGTALRTASIRGALGSNSWTITGNAVTILAGSVTSGFNAAVSGSIGNFTIRAGGFAGAITAGSVTTLSITGGLTGTVTAGTARTVRVIGNVQSATLDFTGAGTSLTAFTATGAMNNTSLTTAGNTGSIVAGLFSNDTILIGATAGNSLANVTASALGAATLGTLRLTDRNTTTFSNTTLLVNALTSATLGTVDTANSGIGGIALAKARSVTGTENGTQFRFTAASTTPLVFGNFEIDLVTGT